MKKKLAYEIRKAFSRLSCSHWYWHRESPFGITGFTNGTIICNNCGKRKLIEELKDNEILVKPWRYEI